MQNYDLIGDFTYLIFKGNTETPEHHFSLPLLIIVCKAKKTFRSNTKGYQLYFFVTINLHLKELQLFFVEIEKSVNFREL